ncbi:MAG: hypothetical protein RQ966_17720 [Acetobacteraceae bacterium]|nr:hypothetical protein [Acetobacteraceae bacterium]
MPDRSDVEQALAALIAATIYPEGVSGESAPGSLCKIYRGWPVANALENDLSLGVVHISVVSVSGVLKQRTRYMTEWQGECPPPTMIAVASGELVTFSGQGGPGQVAGIAVDGQAYAYRMRAGDSASLVAAALAALIRTDRPAVAVGCTVHLLNGRSMLARVVTDGIGGQELRRQEGRFRVSFWCPDPATRDLVVSLVDTGLADCPFIDVGGWSCRLQLADETVSDEGSAGGLWRRDLSYSVEYPTVRPETLPAMLFGVACTNSVARIG